MTEPAKILEAMQTAVTALEPLEPAERADALAWIAKTQGAGPALGAATGAGAGGTDPQGGGGDDLTPKQFVAAKRPDSELERYLCLAYYLTHHRAEPAFKTDDISRLAVEAAQPKFTNASQRGKDAVKDQLLAAAGAGKRQLTDLGERVVEALPDRQTVKEIRAEARKPRRRRGAPQPP